MEPARERSGGVGGVRSGVFTESVVEQAALAWLESVGGRVRNGAGLAPGELRIKEAKRVIKETTV